MQKDKAPDQDVATASDERWQPRTRQQENSGGHGGELQLGVGLGKCSREQGEAVVGRAPWTDIEGLDELELEAERWRAAAGKEVDDG